MMNNWTFKEDGRAWHITCNCEGKVELNNKIHCYNCSEVLPSELELPAKVYGAYNNFSSVVIRKRMDKILQANCEKVFKNLEQSLFIDGNGKK